MPAYNTRKVSLSLPSLGIALPGTGNGARRPSPGSATASPSTSKPTTEQSKKRKAANDTESQSPRPTSIPRKDLPTPAPTPSAHTPPPSPPQNRSRSIEMADAPAPAVVHKPFDIESINDEIVEAVIRVLISQGNRPHLVKELATILIMQLRIVQQSANPCAIISSRLSTFLKRPCWSPATPCPLAKELEAVHPRRTYFYLTTCPHPPLAEAALPMAAPIIQPRPIVTPSLSSGTSASDDSDERRRELSPSPEVELSSPEFDDLDDDLPMPTTPRSSLSGRVPFLVHHHHNSRNHRGTSPPLEKDEKEFTQTANVLQQRRKASGHLLATAPVDALFEVSYSATRDDALFGGFNGHQQKTLSPVVAPPTMNFSLTSPAMRPLFGLNPKRDVEADSWARLDSLLEWDRSPENVELDELDGLLVDF